MAIITKGYFLQSGGERINKDCIFINLKKYYIALLLLDEQ
jgi:hypothetical protein